MTTSRERFIEAACKLIERQGYHATGLNQIVEESGAPKGSLYYHFPGGKAELAVESIRSTGAIVEGRIRASLEEVDDPAEAVERFVRTLAHHVAASGYERGGAITTVALESAATNEPINAACREVYAGWRAAFASKLAASGLDGARAARLAALIVAALEGGIVLSRTEHSVDPLESVACELALLIENAK